MPPEQAEAAAETPAVTEPVDSPDAEAAEAPADEGGDEGGEGDGEAPAAEAPEGEPPAAETAEGDGEKPAPKPKSPVAQLQGRVGHLTRTLHEKDTELANERRQREALEELLAGRDGAEAEGKPPRTASGEDIPAPGTPEFDRLVDARAAEKAKAETFTRDCNTIFDSGVTKHGEDAFKEAVTNLNVLGLMDESLVEAAMATDAPSDVIHYLGADVDEAARIRGLSPIRMAAEMVKLASKLSAPAAREDTPVSRTPPPIKPIGGDQQTNPDLSNPNQSMDDYVRARKAQGSRWAR